MSPNVPNLDDLDFEQLFEEARGLIPRYAPEWTDHNLHDPGITLLDLLAWLVDQEIYTVGFVGPRYIEAFAALLGVRRAPGRPARGLLWPHPGTIGGSFGAAGAELPAGARVTCVEQPEVPFELETAVRVMPARLAETPAAADSGDPKVVAWTGNRRMAAVLNQTGEVTRPLEVVFDQPLVEVTRSLSTHPIALGIELDTEERAGTAPATLRGELIVDYRPEHEGEPWRRTEIVEDGTLALNRTGTVLLRIPPQPQLEAKTRSRLRLSTRQRVHPIPPRIVRVALNVLPIVQREAHSQAVLGRSTGFPDQTFQLPRLPTETQDRTECLEVSDVSKFIEVEERGTLRPWTATDDLERSGPEATRFELDLDARQIVFGNGVNGKIPARDAQIRHLGYRVNLGSAGNLAAGLHWTVQGAPPGRGKTSYGTNPASMAGGADRWNLERLRQEARRRARRRRVLLTNRDLADAVLALEGLAVERAEVQVGHHPALPYQELPGTRALIVTPARPSNTDPLVRVPKRYLSAVERALEPRRVLGERLSIFAAERVPVSVQARLLIEDGFDRAVLEGAARARLDARLSDVVMQSGIEPWPVGRHVTRREIQALLAAVAGVIAVPECRLARGGSEHSDKDLPLAPDEIAIGVAHVLSLEATPQRRASA